MSLWRHSSICFSAHAVAWSPLAHAPHKWNPCQVDNPTFPSVPDGTAPGPADDLVPPEVPDAFLAGRAECSPTLWFCDDQDRVGQVNVQASRGCGYSEVSNFTSQSYSQKPRLGVKANSPPWRLMWVSTQSYWQLIFYLIHNLTVNSA